MVAAVESEAVERALVRVLQGPAVENAVQGALDSERVKAALIEALDSEMVDEVWRRLLASDEAQKLVERIAEAPELRAAISAQSVGLIGDIGRKIGAASRSLDDGAERIARRVVSREPREQPTQSAGAVSRLLAFALDGLIVNLAFTALAALATLIASAFSGNPDGVSNVALALGSAAWVGLGACYLVFFWSLAGQTPGMDFFGIRLGAAGIQAVVPPVPAAAGRDRPRTRSRSGSASSGSSSTNAGAAGRTGSPASTSSTSPTSARPPPGRLWPRRRTRRPAWPPRRRRPRIPGAFVRSTWVGRR